MGEEKVTKEQMQETGTCQRRRRRNKGKGVRGKERVAPIFKSWVDWTQDLVYIYKECNIFVEAFTYNATQVSCELLNIKGW